MGKRNEPLNPIKHFLAHDFYPIPGFSRYGVSEDGRVINFENFKFVKFQKGIRGYLSCTISPDPKPGEIIKNKKFVSRAVHRLMALTFLDSGDEHSIDELQVNHKDGNTSNNHINNLEWVTPAENVQHAIQMSMYNNKYKILEVRNYETKEVLRFYTVASCARHFNMKEDMIEHRLFKGPEILSKEGYQFRIGHSDNPWPEPSNANGLIANFGNMKKVLVRYLLTNEVKEFNCLGDAAKELGIKISTISTWVNNKDGKVQPVYPGCVQLKFAYDPTPWRKVEDPYLELQEWQGRAVIQVVNDTTGEKTIYESAKECAVAHGIGVTTLNWRLKSQGKNVYNDGFRYGYYPY